MRYVISGYEICDVGYDQRGIVIRKIYRLGLATSIIVQKFYLYNNIN